MQFRTRMKWLAWALLLTFGVRAQELMDLAPFARPCCVEDRHTAATTFDYALTRGLARARDGAWVYGLQWAEERDIERIRVHFRNAAAARGAVVEYWFRNWPYNPPHMPTIEDPVDDPWQGEWLSAHAAAKCAGGSCEWTFAPLTKDENPRAGNLPGVPYRHTIRLRLKFPAGPKPSLNKVEVFSETTVKNTAVRVAFSGADKATYKAYNGRIVAVKQESGSAVLSIASAAPAPPGSNDVTIIEVRNGDQSFAFTPSDADKGPMWLPDFKAWITRGSDAVPKDPSSVLRPGAKIRERLAREPEQSYQRASNEIPSLDPVERQEGAERLYLPLAADASWQKFALEWGGNVHISQGGTKAMGRELARLTWPGDRIGWRIGTGDTPEYRPTSADSSLEFLEDALPIATARWKTAGIEYVQESFATLLRGPLSPEDPARSEQTPAVLMMRMRARNMTSQPQSSHLWLGMEPAEKLEWRDGFVTADGGRSVRMAIKPESGSEAAISPNGALHIAQQLAPGQTAATTLMIPFIPGLDQGQRAELQQLDYGQERTRVEAYWREVLGRGMPFRVPEQRFNSFARGLPARIRISVTKDPASGRYMLPAASYGYQVYANEAVFQCQLLDVAGYHDLASKYLQTFVDLQGSEAFAGAFQGDMSGIYHGARVNDEYDYTASKYNLDQGAVLWSLAEHYFVTRDRVWLQSVSASMKRAADWIVAQRKLTQVMVDGERCPENGLLPAGNLEDPDDWGHWFSVNAYASLGMTELGEALAEIGDADAQKYTREAEAYRVDLRSAVQRAAAASPVIQLRDKTWVPYVPTKVHQRIRLFGPLRTGYYSRYPEKVVPTYRLSATRELLYGPLILMDAGIYHAREPIAAWVLDDWEDNATMSWPLGLHVHGWVDEEYWFSRGGMVFQANLQNPIRTYIRRGEARAAIRNLYNDFVACYYPAVNVFTEEFRQWRRASGPFYKTPDEAKFVHRLRDILVTEYDNELLLAAATPGRWLAPGPGIDVTQAPTRYGPVSYSLRREGNDVRATVTLPTRNGYRNAWLSVRLPEGEPISSVTVDGREYSDIDRAHSRIRLPKSGEPMQLVIRVAATH